MTDIFGKGESSSDTSSEEDGQEQEVMEKIETGMPHCKYIRERLIVKLTYFSSFLFSQPPRHNHGRSDKGH